MNLAIKGHATRGKEVIEILGILGGSNAFGHIGNNPRAIYHINENYKNFIICSETKKVCDYIIFTLEEFLEKFPYKVGDKVTHNMGILMNVVHMRWDAGCNVIRYDIQSPVDNNYNLKAMLAEHLQPYKEETTEERQYKELRMPLDDDDKLATEVTIDGNKILPPNGYLIGKITQVDNGMLVEYVKQQPQYPKTYAECCRVVNANPYIMLTYDLSDGQKYSYDADNIELHNNFRRLKICRDAYWNIAGEQIGLDKPWEPDWLNVEQEKYVLFTHNNAIDSNFYVLGHNILAFPTAEMRDAFYENFKELIETCKELL